MGVRQHCWQMPAMCAGANGRCAWGRMRGLNVSVALGRIENCCRPWCRSARVLQGALALGAQAGAWLGFMAGPRAPQAACCPLPLLNLCFLI